MCVCVCVCIGKRERRGERERERARVCVWKKEAEPVNGELAGFLPLETTISAAVLLMWTLPPPEGNGSRTISRYIVPFPPSSSSSSSFFFLFFLSFFFFLNLLGDFVDVKSPSVKVKPSFVEASARLRACLPSFL